MDSGHSRKDDPEVKIQQIGKKHEVFSSSAPERGDKSAQANLIFRNKGGLLGRRMLLTPPYPGAPGSVELIDQGGVG